MNLGTAQIIRANALDLPLPDSSVDLIVTSPPYFGLRSYQDGGQHYEGQIGDEATPAEFVDALIAATREMVRVVKPSGSIWVNLGDKYAGSGMGGNTSLANSTDYLAKRAEGYHPKCASAETASATTDATESATTSTKGSARRASRRTLPGLPPSKSLLGIPWRYALRCIDDLGLILRAEVIWSKPNGLPESVTDRVRRSHEQWFHFVQQPRYFSAVDEVRDQYDSLPSTWRTKGKSMNGGAASGSPSDNVGGEQNPLGKLPGSVRTVPTEPLRVPDHLGVDHFAAFPTAWPKWIIQGWAPTRGVCVACGEGRRPTSTSSREHVDYLLAERRATERVAATAGAISGGTKRSTLGHQTTRDITGYACACPEPTADTTPAVILDPFGGTGTTALVAKALGCHGISVDMSADYCRLAEWRTNDPGQLAKVLGVDKPPEVDPAQADLFDLLGGDAA